MKFRLILTILFSYFVSNAADNKSQQGHPGNSQVSINIELPRAVTDMPYQIAEAGRSVSQSLTAAAAVITRQPHEAVENISRAGSSLSHSVESSVNNVKNETLNTKNSNPNIDINF